MLTVVAGAPFSGKDRWIAAQIERREADGARGLLSLSFTGLFAALSPGAESVYRDAEVSDSGAPRFVGWLLATAISQAATRELVGFVAVDSPRRAVELLGRIGGSGVIEVAVSQATAHRRAGEHLDLIRELAPRAGADDADAEARCRRVVDAYYHEREVLDTVDVRTVDAPDRPSDASIQYAWRAAIRASKRGDTVARDTWISAAKRQLATRGIKA